MELLVIADVDISHIRLIDLTQLADRAKPFYDWIEGQFRLQANSSETLDELLMRLPRHTIEQCIAACYYPDPTQSVPKLFDGIGRLYAHPKACFYFFAWLIRDAPQQRLSPLVQQIAKRTQKARRQVEIEVLAALIVHYRSFARTFQWSAIREVIMDRLEGSRRSIRGREKEIVVRGALAAAFQEYFEKRRSYGIYTDIEVLENQVTIGHETYDVCIQLLDEKNTPVRRILVPIKTRETEGGGHAHLFTRDVRTAVDVARREAVQDYIFVVIIASNWSERETVGLVEIVDHLVHLKTSPNTLLRFDEPTQQQLNAVIERILDGQVLPKRGNV
ncbi:MAG: hypothetical protein RML95_01995 [Anaerolineae bacterium]|nr:hypothetical protein [Anaerolineae bacterium]MDW8298088.1 hypothetical protein [Anaerolineae bacterium]